MMTSLFRTTLVAMLALPFLLTGCQCSKDANEAPTAPVEAPPVMEEEAPVDGAPEEMMPPEAEEAPADAAE